MDYQAANSSDSTPDSPYVVPEDIGFKLFGIVAIAANILILTTLLRFKKLRTAPYMLLANWSISDLCSMLFLQAGILISLIKQNVTASEVTCICIQSAIVMHSSTIIFVSLVATDWALAAYSLSASEKFRKRYQLVVGIAWVIVICMDFLAVYSCSDDFLRSILQTSLVMIILCICASIVVLIHIIRLVKKLRRKSSEHPALAINLTTAFLGCWALGVIIATLIYVLEFNLATIVISYCIVYANSFINLGCMYWFNNEFAACVRQMFNCKQIQYEEDLGEAALIQDNVVQFQFGGMDRATSR